MFYLRSKLLGVKQKRVSGGIYEIAGKRRIVVGKHKSETATSSSFFHCRRRRRWLRRLGRSKKKVVEKWEREKGVDFL